ncbi:MAG: polyprenyl diphosphate synthase [Candidatus Cryptobacteroides sp.]
MENPLRIPQHVSIIMDGNGRWAKERGKERYYGHLEGVESVRACTIAAAEYGVKYLSLFAFSEENWGRPDKEVDFLMDLMVDCIRKELHLFLDNDIRLLVLGNRGRLDSDLNKAIDDCVAQTAENKRMTLIVFLSYSGKWDIMQAASRIAADYASCPERRPELENITPEVFSRYLVTDGIPDPDLIIRTSGEQRLSNYLLWQSAYSEFYFTDVLWPDFRKESFLCAMKEYSQRDRRYGKVK